MLRAYEVAIAFETAALIYEEETELTKHVHSQLFIMYRKTITVPLREGYLHVALSH